ncbi:MAG: nitroreductase family deazaflavin-dependent oxidoreductase [Acidimicrobiales bacterium]
MASEDSIEDEPSTTRPRKRRNPFTGSSLGGRILSASQLPWFLLFPPKDYGVLETTGRKSGQRRRCCLRIVHRGNRACLVAIGGHGVGWLANMTDNPTASIRIRGGWRTATATIGGDAVDVDLLSSYRESVGLFSYGEYLMWRPGRPTKAGIRDLHTTWTETGVPVALVLDD